MEGRTDVCVNRGKNILPEHTNQDVSPTKSSNRLVENSSDDDEAPIQRIKKRLQHFSDSDEKENINSLNDDNNESEAEDKLISTKSGLTESRIQLGGVSSDSDLPEESELKNEQQIRLTNKRIKMKQKFHGLSSRSKSTPVQCNSDVQSGDNSENTNSEGSENEMSSIAKIKQKIKKSMAAIPSICDPDTSDEESNTSTKIAPKQRQKKTLKAAKMIEAQPMRMSAKQAIENMQLIKSESNRMLREKTVSLPYHRPKALTLKDIMSRRKPAVSSDGKVLPIKMNEEQLKHYALQLEQRQKEMMELCKSESDEETVEKCEELDIIIPKSTEEIVSNIPESESSAPAEKMADLVNPEEGEVGAKIDNNTYREITAENTACVDSENIKSIRVDEAAIKSAMYEDQSKNESINSENNQNDSNTDVRLVYNDDSVEKDNSVLNNDEVAANGSEMNHQSNKSEENVPVEKHIPKEYSEQSSQSIHLNYTETNSERIPEETIYLESEEIVKNQEAIKEVDFFSDDDLEMADIDLMIENAEMLKDNEDDASVSKPINYRLQIKPRLTGAPGMVIDLDGTGPIMQKRSGVELLKEKFTYFSKLKTPEEMEREKEKRFKPGAQHLKLRQELEEKIAEQRSLEWAKRLEEEKQNNQELDDILDDADNADDSIEKIKSKLNEEDGKEESDSENEEELEEDDIEIKDKPRKHNPMVDYEAEESDIDEGEQETGLKEIDGNVDNIADDEESVADDKEDSSDKEESSESEEEYETGKVRKGRILKAFEDSDEEDTPKDKDIDEIGIQNDNISKAEIACKDTNEVQPNCAVPGSSEDDIIQLAQRPTSVSEDLFTSQEYSAPTDVNNDANEISGQGTQSFSISSAKPNDFLCPSQPYHDPNLKEIADGFSQNMLGSQQSSQSQPIGEDILALCTGKFYENEFVSQNQESIDFMSQNSNKDNNINQNDKTENVNENNIDNIDADIDVSEKVDVLNTKPIDNDQSAPKIPNEKNNEGCNLLKSILDELDDPDFDKPKENKYFTGGQNKNNSLENTQMKKRLIIDSDDEVDNRKVDTGKKKKLKKKKLEDRALQFSDDEEEDEDGLELEEEYESDIEDDSGKLVEYDSEENEIVVKPDELKKKRKATDFFEQEAELTSEDEWVGSGDEDEKGLDRMEREEGDDDVFHQGKLQKELGQIHMRDVLDQDKREVRLLQELLFEDGDLGDGHRQRKFRWKNTEDEEAGTVPDEFADTQEEEFESEEQWRKQRHEREVFLRQMKKQDEDGTTVNVTVNRTTIIKANLTSKSMSSLLMEANQSKTENTYNNVPEKKPVKDLPSPKKMFSILKQNYHGSLLTRGRGALARLAALATPLAVDDDAPKIGSLAPHKRNFVFTALTPDDKPPKVSIKRKADVSTPRLVKKMRTEEKQSRHKSSLLDHLNL